MPPRMDPLLQETIIACIAMTCLGVLVALLYWGLTGLSPWPGLVMGEIGGFGLGVVLLVLSSPKRRHNR